MKTNSRKPSHCSAFGVRCLTLSVTLALLLSGGAVAATRCVWQSSPFHMPPYTSWATAATNIQDAVDQAQDGESVEPGGGYRTVETVVRSGDDFRKQFADFQREGWSIHLQTKQKTNEDGGVVWRWKMSRPTMPDPAPVDFSSERRWMKIAGSSEAELRQELALLQSEGWAIHDLSRVITNADGAMTRTLKMSRHQTTEAENRDKCVHNLYQLRQAIRQWALDNGKSLTNRVALTDLEVYFGSHEQFPTCPSGGGYSVHTVWDPPACSIPEHRLMQSYMEWRAQHE